MIVGGEAPLQVWTVRTAVRASASMLAILAEHRPGAIGKLSLGDARESKGGRQRQHQTKDNAQSYQGFQPVRKLLPHVVFRCCDSIAFSESLAHSISAARCQVDSQFIVNASQSLMPLSTGRGNPAIKL